MSLLDYFDIKPEEGQEQTKVCIHCGNEKLVSMFFKNRTGYDNRCISCHGSRKRDVERLRKNPSTPAMPERCECCGRENPKKFDIPGRMGYNLNLDHYYDNGKPFFRGWVCKQCNSGIGYLGDDITGVFNAMSYLLKSLPEEKWNEFVTMLKEERTKVTKRLEELDGRPIQRCDTFDTTDQEECS